ncbi:SGNH/GDSL hydrolase family protein [Hahella sp. CR1]|uniref:SGNH/GDSL hydrolase family protein n=1 Tax=Hahella sp. CR1 TaxID=2992807 RepID=UPI0024429DD8|nr:SGNH/GDSL hydrolase family protein [Hahella sp. CR1]MDG9668973.1 SGNH/GDSL hydrolase family protein [Hahella sp. CR1]
MARQIGQHYISGNLNEFIDGVRQGVRREYPNILLEGDSWFDYPGRGWGALNAPNNIFEAIAMLEPQGANWLDLAISGATTLQMQPHLQHYRRLKHAHVRLDYIFISAGGNDIFANLAPILAPYKPDLTAQQCLRQDILDTVLSNITDFYKSSLEMRDRYHPNAIVVSHGYSAPLSRERGWKLFLLLRSGPWISSVFELHGYPPAEASPLRHDIIRIIHGRLSDALAETLSQYDNTLFYDAQTRRLNLTGKEFWADEIHLSAKGYKNFGADFIQFLEENQGYAWRRKQAIKA